MCYYAHKSPLQVISALWLAFKIVFAQVVLIFKLFFRGLRPLTLEDSQVYSKNFPLGVLDGKNALPKHVPNLILQRTTS